MSNKDIAEMIDIALGILITLGIILWFWLYLKIDKIYDELKEIREEKKREKNESGNSNPPNPPTIGSNIVYPFGKKERDEITYRELIDYCKMERKYCAGCPYNRKECEQFIKAMGYAPWYEKSL